MSILTLEQCFQKCNLSIVTFIGQLLLAREFGPLLFYSLSARGKSYMACFDLAVSFLKAVLSFTAPTLKLTCHSFGPGPFHFSVLYFSLFSHLSPVSNVGINNSVLMLKPWSDQMRSHRRRPGEETCGPSRLGPGRGSHMENMWMLENPQPDFFLHFWWLIEIRCIV